ncbi:MAG: response regulator [Deltaproteobacteria bacterium]|nr:response regulator [Deltaproteobacteria bacterium]
MRDTPVPGGGRRTVLVVEDDRDSRDTLRELLELEGWPVATARNGGEGLARMRELRPGLVLLDLLMPGMGGAEVCRQRAADPSLLAIPVALITADLDLAPELRSPELVGRLEKPIRIPELLALVERYCGAGR